MTFGGVDLMRWIDGVKSIERNVGQNMTNSLIKIGREPGEHFQYTSPSHGTITVTALILNKPDRRALASALTVDKPQQLVFGDEPDKYYMAIPDAQTTLTEAYQNNVLTIVFIVPDGIAHSVATKTADNMPYKDVPVNSLADSGFESGQTPANYLWSDGKSTNRTFQAVGQLPLLPMPLGNYMLIIENDSTDSSLDPNQYASYPITPGLIKKGETWTYSYYYASAGSATGQASDYLMADDGSPIFELSMAHDSRDNSGVKKTWHRFVKMWTADRDVTVNYLRFGFIKTSASPGWVCIDNIKLEQEPTASPWSPNPADPEYYADTITVHNGGTYPVYPFIDATMHSDNGVLALINESNGGVLQFGDAQQVDGEEKQKSEQVVDYAFSGGKPDSGLTVNAGNVFFNDSGRSKIEGKFVSSITNDAVVPTFVGTSSDRWNGPTLHSDIQMTVEGVNTGNFLFKNRANFRAAVGNIGRIEFILNSPDGVAMVFVMRDATITKKQMIIESWCMGKQLDQREVDLDSLNSDFFEVQMGRIGSQLLFQIAKISKLTGDVPSYDSKITITPDFSDFSNVPITSMTTWFATFGNHTASSMAWTDSKFIWSNINFWQDFSNTFSNGDVLTIDTQSRGIAVNGVNVSGLQSIDNDWEKFKLPTGDNHISINCSSFASMPTVAATIREAYL